MDYRTKAQDAQQPHGVEEVKLEPLDQNELPLGTYKPCFGKIVEIIQELQDRASHSNLVLDFAA